MSIANELSCDVATALLTRHATLPAPPQTDLTELVISFHDALRQLTREERGRRRALVLATTPPAASNNAAAAST